MAALAVLSCAPADSPTDSDGKPTVTILSPGDGLTVREGATVTFTATATDPENGDLSESIEWRGEPDRWLGTGGSIEPVMEPGHHLVSARVQDSDGNAAVDQVTVEVEEDLPPSVTLLEPEDGVVVSDGTELTFVASAMDAEDGDLTSELVWRSYPGGAFGSGGNARTTLPRGRSVVRATAEDSRGQHGWADVEVRVAGRIVPGESHEGSVVDSAHVDLWEFEAEEGDHVLLALGTTTPSYRFRPRVRVEAPDGGIVASASASSSVYLDLDVTVTGTYRVLVDSDDHWNRGYGDYRMTLATLADGATLPEALDRGVLTNGWRHAGEIDVGGMRFWRFDVAEDDFVVVSVGPEDGESPVEPRLILMAPDGTLHTPPSWDPQNFVELRAPEGGTWTVVVVAHDSQGVAHPVRYILEHARVPGTFSVPEGDDGGELTNGDAHRGALDLIDLDLWTFHAEEGDFLALGAHAEDFLLALTLVSPTGEPLALDRTFPETVAPITGTYTVIVRSPSRPAVGGDYALTLARVPGSVTVADGDEGGEIVGGAAQVGSLEPGDLDLWTFDAEEGDWLGAGIGQSAPTPDFPPRFVLVSPSGEVLGSAEASRSAYIETVAPASGTYTVVARSRGPAPGEYRLVVASVPGELSVAAGDEGGPLADGSGHTGTIPPGDIDFWSFDGAAGETVVVKVVEQDPQTDVTLRIVLLSPEGAVVESAWGGQEARIEATLDTTGAYTVVVGPYHPNPHGAADYVLTLTR